MDKLPSKTFCIIPWSSICIPSHGDVRPCCITDWDKGVIGNIKDMTLKEIWNHDTLKSLRLDMVNGVENDICKICYNEERNNGYSKRRNMNEAHSHFPHNRSIPKFLNNMNPDGSMKNFELDWLDVRFSSVCNYKCRTCNQYTSSQWALEEAQFSSDGYKDGYLKDSKSFHLLEEETKFPVIPQLKETLKNTNMVYFSGGEPLLHLEHYEMLEHLIDIGNTDIALKYNSNGSVLGFKDKNIIELWKHFKNVEFYISIDGIGEREEYIRHGADWQGQIDNILQIQKEAPHVMLNFNTVVSIFNVLTIPELLDEMIKLKLLDLKTHIAPSLDILVAPSYFNLNVLDKDTRGKAIENISNWIGKNLTGKDSEESNLYQQLQNIITYLKNNQELDELRSKTKKEIDKIDSRRNENFVKTFPELAHFYELCRGE